jgi:LacI family transcriptional regulator/LacI family repressor for deo operon, udp, cdd, tsx, nupC, and nupG
MKKHQVTIIDIARELNISKSTVSRALHGHQDINGQTKKKILELACKLDYQPNLLATSLVMSKSYTVGMLVPEFLTPFFPSVIMGAQEVMSKAGYNVMICQSNESYEMEVANTKALLASRVDGILASVTRETRNFDHFQALHRKGIPVVFFNRVCDELDVSKVVVDDYEGAFLAVEHLIATGRRRIAHLAGPNTLLISRNRLKGYMDALQKYGLPVDEELIIHYDLTPEKATIYIKHLLDLPSPPDALFAINDPTAIAAMLVIKDKGLRIPQDIAVVGFSNDPSSALIEPGLTTVAQPVFDIGREAARLFLDQVDTNLEEYKPQTKVLQTRLIIRGSSINKAPFVS